MDPLPLSLLNDYLYCHRRAALKVVEGWRSGNEHTNRGDIIHEHADLELFWQALSQMFDHDRSASRGTMSPQKLIVFKHQTALGNAPAHKLFDRVQVARKPGVEVGRSFADYSVTIERDSLPTGVELIEML